MNRRHRHPFPIGAISRQLGPPREPVASYGEALRQGLSRQSVPVMADTLVVTPLAR